MNTPDYIAVASVAATCLGALVTWLVMKRQFASKKLSYSYVIEPILTSSDPNLALDLKVSYKGEELARPTLLSVEIVNVGSTAVENAEVVISLPGATYLIPGYFADLPEGYSMLWKIERTDAEECTVRFSHINPKQIARIRLLMDESPSGDPTISCAMPNVEFTKASQIKISGVAKLVVEALAPQVMALLRK